MSKSGRLPPVPPGNASPKGPGDKPETATEGAAPERENFSQQGRHGNIKQNTTNQGYQQDR